MTLQSSGRLGSVKRIFCRKRENKSGKGPHKNPEKQSLHGPRDQSVAADHMNHGGEASHELDSEDSEGNPNAYSLPLGPKSTIRTQRRTRSDFTTRENEVERSSQRRELSFQKPSRITRQSRRSKTWESVKSATAKSIRSVNTAAQEALGCVPRLRLFRPRIHSRDQFLHIPATTGISPDPAPGTKEITPRSQSIPEGIPEESHGHTSYDDSALYKSSLGISHRAFPRSRSFPLDKSTMSGFTELAIIRAKLKERERTSEYFNQIWEDEALPRLKETMDKGNITDYNISIQADYGESGVLRIVEVVTRKKLPDNINQELRNNVSNIFKPERPLQVTISFTIGVIKRTSGTEDPFNAHSHPPLMIGDSVGFENGDCAATIGPAIKWNDRVGCLVNFHLFDEAPRIKDEQETPDLYLVHPAGIDCPRGKIPQRIAKLSAHSGLKMYQTQRISRSIQYFCSRVPLTVSRVETDWAFCDLEGNGLLLQNLIRYAPNDPEVEPHSRLISEIFSDSPKLRLVRCTGRSSGLRYAVVCETPSVVRQGSGEPTREWYLENVPGLLPVGNWNVGGIGIPGDSGAAIIDDETHAFVGHVWGRNHYEEDTQTGPRLAYFSHIMDIFDDFESRYPEMGRPRLRTETERPPPTKVSADDMPISVVKLLSRDSTVARSKATGSDTTLSAPPSAASSQMSESRARSNPKESADTLSQAHKPMQSRNLKDYLARIRIREETSKPFNEIWEGKALSRLQKAIETIYNDDYSITVQYDYDRMQRIIEVMTNDELPKSTIGQIEMEVSDIFGIEPMASMSAGFHFVKGNVQQSVGDITEDVWTNVCNAMAHSQLMPGDSIGCDGVVGAATLGPAIIVEGKLAYIVSRHLFDGQSERDTGYLPLLRLVHPAGIDCSDGRQPIPIAELHAHSGPAYQTQRHSRTLETFTTFYDGLQVVTDWALFVALESGPQMRNCLRYVPNGREVEPHSEDIAGIFTEKPQLRVIQSTGRSSGVGYGVVCETPAAVRHTSTGRRTREWFLENLEGFLPDDQWNIGGIGIPGDSGAATIDFETQKLMGQVWGRNVYGGDPRIRRITYFTHFVDVFDDIHETSSSSSSMGYPKIAGLPKESSSEPPTLIAPGVAPAGSNDRSLRVGAHDSTPRWSRAHFMSSEGSTAGTTISRRSVANLDSRSLGGSHASLNSGIKAST